MRPDSFYQAQNIDLKLGAAVNAIDVRSREVALDDGSRLAFDHLLLATGSEPEAIRSG
jgi:NAD(P)H-nitrite reductase large subunit